jgi:glycosyltransferase involved in cell wall biosynthesis
VRVALIGPVPPSLGGSTPGGVATHQVHLAAGLSEAGIDASLLATNARDGCPRDVGFPLYPMARPGQNAAAYLSSVGYRNALHYVFAIGFGRHRVREHGSRSELLSNLLWYRRFIAHVQPHLLHVQHPLERSLYVRMVQRLEGWRMPLVITAHSLFGEHSDATIHRLMAPNLKAADRVIAVSDHVASQAMSLGVRDDRISVIRSGVDVDRFQRMDRGVARRQLGFDDEVPLVLFVGNLEPRKQVNVLLRALSRLHQSLPGVRLLVVGSGESAGAQDQTAPLLRLTRELHLDDVAQFVGRVDDQRLLAYYAAADVFALASSSEAQGIVALEAMACGLPVVATSVGGLIGTISDGETGFLVEPGDPARLAERLLLVLRDKTRARQIGAAARESVARNFSWPRTIAETVKVYRQVLTPLASLAVLA